MIEPFYGDESQLVSPPGKVYCRKGYKSPNNKKKASVLREVFWLGKYPLRLDKANMSCQMIEIPFITTLVWILMILYIIIKIKLRHSYFKN